MKNECLRFCHLYIRSTFLLKKLVAFKKAYAAAFVINFQVKNSLFRAFKFKAIFQENVESAEKEFIETT